MSFWFQTTVLVTFLIIQWLRLSEKQFSWVCIKVVSWEGQNQGATLHWRTYTAIWVLLLSALITSTIETNKMSLVDWFLHVLVCKIAQMTAKLMVKLVSPIQVKINTSTCRMFRGVSMILSKTDMHDLVWFESMTVMFDNVVLSTSFVLLVAIFVD